VVWGGGVWVGVGECWGVGEGGRGRVGGRGVRGRGGENNGGEEREGKEKQEIVFSTSNLIQNVSDTLLSRQLSCYTDHVLN